MSLVLDISKKLGAFELNLTFEVQNGFTMLTGPSGSGKTTLLNLISGLLTPDHGAISLHGKTLFDSTKKINLPAHHRRIGYVFQEARLFPHLSVKQNMTYGRWFQKPHNAAVSLPEICQLLGLEPLLNRKPNTLSGGEKQRVAIGRALLANPQLLLMDEPLSALDQPRREEIIPYLERLQNQTALPILYTTHHLEEVVHLMTAEIKLG